MRKLLTTTLVLVACGLIGQSSINPREKYKQGGERNATLEEQGAEHLNAYKAFKKAKAWNYKSSGLLNNVAELGPNTLGGRVRSILVDEDNNINLVAPSGGGLWKFDPVNGKPFVPVDDIGSFLPITSIAQNHFTKSTIYLATGDALHGTVGNGIFKSTDRGATFSLVSSTDPTSDADFKYCQIIKCSPDNQNDIYVAAEAKLFKSTDNGSSWTKVFEGAQYYNKVHSIDFLANGGVIIGVDYSGVHYSSTGNSGSYSLATSGIWNTPTQATNDYQGIVVATQGGNSNTAIAAVAKSNDMKVYKTTNGGASWTELTNPGFTTNQATFSLMVGIHPTDANKILVGSYSWALSQDGGTTWQSGCGLEVDFHTAHFHSSNPDVAYIGYDQGFGSVNFGNQKSMGCWQNGNYVTITQPEQIELGKKGGFNTLQIYYGDYYPSGDNFLVGHQDGGCMSKKDGAEGRIRIGDGGSVFVSKQNSSIIYASTQYGNLSKSTNGNTPSYGDFNSIGSYNSGNYPHFITQFAGNNADGNQLYIASKTSLDRTTDAGASFNTIMSIGLSGTKVAVSNATNPILYALGYNTSNGLNSDIIRITNAKTANSGTTISNVLTYSNDNRPKEITVDPNDENTVYITSTNGAAYKVSNLNATHSIASIKGDMGDVVVNMVIGIDSEVNYLFAATNIGLYYSKDGGTTWTLSSKIPHTKITDLKYRASDKRLFIFTHGRGTFAADFDKAVSVNSLKKIDVKVYPNPTSDFISVNLQGINNPIINIFDINGNLVMSKSSQEDQLNLNISELANGQYILHTISNKQLVATNKIIKK